MRLFDANTELLLIRTMVENQTLGVDIISKITSEFFGSDSAKEVFNRILFFVQSGKSIPSIELLRTDRAMNESTLAWLATDIKPLPPSDIDQAINNLSKHRQARLIMESLNSTVEEMRGDDPNIEKVLMSIESMLSKCRTGLDKDEMFHICESNLIEVEKTIEEGMEPDTGNIIPSGFRMFDKTSGGFRRKNVLTLASVPGGGKSAMAEQMAIYQYMMGYNVCMVSFEMSKEELVDRLLANISHINCTDITVRRLMDKQKELIRQKSREFVQTGLGNRLTLWPCTKDMNIPELQTRLKPYGFDAIYIDYLGLLKPYPGKAGWESLGDHSRDAKRMASVLNALIVPLAQYDDETLKIKYAKAIIANSDFVWTWTNDVKEKESGIIRINQEKARSREPFPFYLFREFSRMSWEDYNGAPPVQEEVKEEPRKLPKMKVG